MDYTSGPYIVIFPAGVTLATFSIPITDDNTLEGPGHFMITIDPISLPIDVTVGNPNKATVTITHIHGRYIVANINGYTFLNTVTL